jgi:hypothetical protein
VILLRGVSESSEVRVVKYNETQVEVVMYYRSVMDVPVRCRHISVTSEERDGCACEVPAQHLGTSRT